MARPAPQVNPSQINDPKVEVERLPEVLLPSGSGVHARGRQKQHVRRSREEVFGWKPLPMGRRA